MTLLQVKSQGLDHVQRVVDQEQRDPTDTRVLRRGDRDGVGRVVGIGRPSQLVDQRAVLESEQNGS